MRAVLAASLALFLAFVALAPHVHTGAHGAEDCAVCVASARGAEPAVSESPNVAPRVVLVAPAIVVQVFAPVLGAPLGSIPGQSPPRG